VAKWQFGGTSKEAGGKTANLGMRAHFFFTALAFGLWSLVLFLYYVGPGREMVCSPLAQLKQLAAKAKWQVV
jgi:hypothetical protein